MNNKKVLLTAIIFSAISTGAMAVDGKITFNGEVVTQSCVVDNGNQTKTVELPKVGVGALKKLGDVSGTTPFTIELSGCDAEGAIKDVGLSFIGSNIDLTTNTLTTKGVGKTKADNVNIALYNQDDSLIKLGADAKNQNINYAKISAEKVQLNYFAKYYATAQATAGLVESNVDFEIIYK